MSVVVPDAVVAEVNGTTTRVARHVDIYESDGVTPWRLNVPFTEGSVSVDMGSQEERRNAAITLESNVVGEEFDVGAGGLWYDKIVKPYRGVILPDNTVWEAPLGVFMVDKIDASNFPYTVSISCRDLTKKLMQDQFGQTTTFIEGLPLEEVISTVAINGGIDPAMILMPGSGKALGKDFVFEDGTERFKAVSGMASDYGFDLYFDASGYLVLIEQTDPTLDPVKFTFSTGSEGNLVSWKKGVNDSRLYNHVVVKGEGGGTIPVYGEVENNNPDSPSAIAKIGRRTYRYTSKFINTEDQALDTATKFLAVHSLEEYNVDMEALVVPWLEAGMIVAFEDPRPNVGQPTKFLMHNFTIPLSLTSMSVNARRAELVG